MHLCRPDSRLLLSTAYDGTVTVMDANAAEPQVRNPSPIRLTLVPSIALCARPYISS